MARHTWLAMLTLLAATVGLPTYAADTTNADVQAINKIEQEWTEAVKTRDKAFYEKYFSSDFIYTSEKAVVVSGRAAYIDAMMKAPKMVEATGSDERVTVHGMTGIATGRFTTKDSTGVSTTTLYTDVYAKDADGWKAVASQETTTK